MPAWSSLLLLFLFLQLWSSPTSSPAFKPLYQTMKLKINKKSPPAVAFYDSVNQRQKSQWDVFQSDQFSQLSTEATTDSAWRADRKVILSQMLIRIEKALPEEWPKKIIASNERYIASANFNSKENSASGAIFSGQEITGHLEIQGGLAVLNTSHIEVRRIKDGIEQDLGDVNIKDGTYSIELSDRQGLLVGRLVDKNGRTWGEGQVRLENVFWESLKKSQGPTLKISPTLNAKGQLLTPYTLASNSKNSLPSTGAKARFVNGAINQQLEADGNFSVDELKKSSSTLVRFEGKGFMPTQQIYSTGMTDKAVIMPANMMASLKSIVSEQKQYNLFDPEAPVIWGQVTQDGQSSQGIRVELEMHPEFEVTYFNDFFLPDEKQTTTGKNGLFAIINPPQGYLSLAAYQGERLYSYQNTVVDKGVASYVEMQSTLKTKNTSVSVFDAFSGTEVTSKLTMQSAQDEFLVSGQKFLRTEEVVRWGLLKSENEDGYINAHYLYNDKEDYVRVPLFQPAWIESIMLAQRINQSTNKAVVIGLVPEKDYQVDLMIDDQQNSQIIYFDATGAIIKENKGRAGGGFIIFNAPPDVFETVVSFSQDDDQVMSRLIPGQPGDTLVTEFR